MDDDVLLYLRELFVDVGEVNERLRRRYTSSLENLKRRVLDGNFSGIRYHATVQKMKADAMNEGLSETEFEHMCDEIEDRIDYARLRVHVAPFD
jgi:hypothetical protein